MNISKYVHWGIINSYLTIPEYNQFDVLKYVYNAIRDLNIRQAYSQKVCLKEVKNHKADLPEDLLLLESIAYLNGTPSEEDIKEINTECSNCMDNHQVVRTSVQQPTAIFPLLPYYFINTKFYRKYFSILKLKNFAYASKYFCENCPSLTLNCEDTFDLIPELNQINTHTIKNGTICVSYLTLPENEEGDLLIPNDPQIFELIASYIKYKYWESQKQMADYMNYNRCNSEYITAQKEYGAKKRSFMGDLLLSTIDSEVLSWYSQKKITSFLHKQF